MAYLYETHLHTVQSSLCGKARGEEYIEAYKEAGYTGIIVTDHFYNGNTAADRTLPWSEWVERFCRGYEETRAEGERHGLDVFFGWEETFEGDDYLIYGLDKDWLLAHPEAASWTRQEQYAAVRRNGGCVVQAHPFRLAPYIRKIHLSTGCVDAVEAANGGNQQAWDALAMRYARKLRLPVTAGSDIHHAGQFETGEIFGVYLTEKMNTIHDYVRAIRENRIAGLRMP
ncbi:MAG: PHP domain-containing protein, partial [Treponema sp.]|nr:PHP domain-containing protein [Treponema sp.]